MTKRKQFSEFDDGGKKFSEARYTRITEAIRNPSHYGMVPTVINLAIDSKGLCDLVEERAMALLAETSASG